MNTKKTIYIIRHGETDFNKRGIIQGSGVDSDLNEKGQSQAQKFFQAYHHIAFDKIYTSELKRTIQSIAPFTQVGCEHEALSALNEISWGRLEGTVSTPEAHRAYLGMIADWKAGLLDRAIEGGESPNSMYKRQEKGFRLLMERKNEQTLLLCMHGRAMRSFMCLLTGKPLSQMDEFKHSNLCLYVLEQREDRFEVIQANSVDHLWI